MRVVVDANAFMACILREGLSRRILFHPELEPVAPAFLIDEILEHSVEVRSKFSGTDEELKAIMLLTARQVYLVQNEELKPYVPAAATLSNDENDWLYLACALFRDALVWSNDRHFSGQKRVRVLGTAELGRELGLLK